MQKALDLAVSKFEAGDITGVVVNILIIICIYKTKIIKIYPLFDLF